MKTKILLPILMAIIFIASLCFIILFSINDSTGKGIITSDKSLYSYEFPEQMAIEQFYSVNAILGNDMPYARIVGDTVSFSKVYVYTFIKVLNPQDYNLKYEGSQPYFSNGQVGVFAVGGFLCSIGLAGSIIYFITPKIRRRINK